MINRLLKYRQYLAQNAFIGSSRNKPHWQVTCKSRRETQIVEKEKKTRNNIISSDRFIQCKCNIHCSSLCFTEHKLAV